MIVNEGVNMKKKVIFIVVGILVFIEIVLLGFFLYEEKLKEGASNKTYYNYFVQEPNVLYYPSEDGYIYAVADFTKQIENYENLINEKEYDEELLGELMAYDTIYMQPNRKHCALLPVDTIKKILKEE